MLEQLVTALGLVLAIEGLAYALVPGQLRRMLDAMGRLSDDQMRMVGTATLGVGVLAIWLARSFLQG